MCTKRALRPTAFLGDAAFLFVVKTVQAWQQHGTGLSCLRPWCKSMPMAAARSKEMESAERDVHIMCGYSFLYCNSTGAANLRAACSCICGQSRQEVYVTRC